jgi:hypothetical protein
MVSREEYARIIELFLEEMTGHVHTYSDAALRALPGVGTELDEHLRLLRDPATQAADALPMAMGLVDEFARATWDATITECYALYVDMSGGRSQHHPDGGTSGSRAAAT